MLTKSAKAIAKSAIHVLITHDMEEWPPSCLGLLYQPMRPKIRTETNVQVSRKESNENNSCRA